jgi:hypothetical protein
MVLFCDLISDNCRSSGTQAIGILLPHDFCLNATSTESLQDILRAMINTGEIAKKDLLKLWSQKEFDQHMPNNDLKEFIIQNFA